jgi:hypothetical protein
VPGRTLAGKAVVPLLGCLLLVTGCSATPAAAPRSVASLPITGDTLHEVTLPPKSVSVRSGSEFSVLVDTTDGPLEWRLTTAASPAVVQGKGQAPVGSCPQQQVGCRVPERYTFLARARGTTTMVWTEYSECPQQTGRTCAAVTQAIRVVVT